MNPPSASTEEVLATAREGDERAFRQLVAPFARELKAHCYRMSGSLHDAEELLQDSLLRAWKGLDTFEGRSGLRTWLYRIATNACLNALEAKRARGMPMDLRPAGDHSEPMVPQFEPVWLEPCPLSLYEDDSPTPEARTSARESVALAFLVALQLLPARQRALLILHDVLGWSAAECGELLALSSEAVNSALQRARATLQARRSSPLAAPLDAASEIRPMLQRYLRAWEAADLPALVSLLHEDATLSMPPIPTWLRGAASLEASMQAMVFATAGPGDFRTIETEANGVPAIALYRRDGASGIHRPYALQILEWRGDQVAGITAFLDASLFVPFGLPERA